VSCGYIEDILETVSTSHHVAGCVNIRPDIQCAPPADNKWGSGKSGARLKSDPSRGKPVSV
jgi:hypothetical protein